MTIKSGKPKRRKGQRGAARHGGYSLLVTGEVPLDRLYVKRYLEDVRAGVIRDLGGEEAMTTLQIVMVDRLVTALGVTRLIEEFAREKGVLANPAGFLNPALGKHYTTYANQVRLAAQALGITARLAPAEDTLAAIKAEYEVLGTMKDTGSPEIVALRGSGEVLQAGKRARTDIFEPFPKSRLNGHTTVRGRARGCRGRDR